VAAEVSRSRLPSPAEFDADLRAIADVLSELRELYRHAYGWSLAPSVGDSAGGVKAHDADPTSAVVLAESKARGRAEARRAAKKVYAARWELYNARNALERVVGPLMRQGARKPAPDAIVTSAELDESFQARLRRLGRGEGIPG
jgi:hypothetical protein